MTLSKESYLAAIKALGTTDAAALQSEQADMTSVQLYEAEDHIPDFKAAVAKKNMMERPAGQTNGFLCRSSVGNIVRLLQNYSSETYPAEPEELPAQWRFFWSTDPKRAQPFVSSSTSYYSKDECCTWNRHVWRSTLETANTWSPTELPSGWEDLGTIEEVMAA